jgi:heme/copper-type cytochrome/quinol oxidase subunit 2
MLFTVKVVTKQQFQQWVDQREASNSTTTSSTSQTAVNTATRSVSK